MNFSKIIGTGSYGYVYYPSLFCMDVSNECGIQEYLKKNDKYVSKLLKKEFAEKELSRYELIRTADPDNKYHLGNMFMANPSRRNIPLLSIHENGKEIIDNFNEYKLIVMKYGGKSLREYGNIFHKMFTAKKPDGNYIKNSPVIESPLKFEKKHILFWKDSLRLVQGIECFIKNQIVHHDIKTANVLFRYECGIRSVTEDIHAYSEGRHRSPSEYDNDVSDECIERNYSNFIDFGLVQSMDSIYEKSKISDYNYSIFYYNFPPEMFFYDKERFDKFRIMNVQEKKLWIQYICKSWIRLSPETKSSPNTNFIFHTDNYDLIEKIMKIPDIDCLLSSYDDSGMEDDFEQSLLDATHHTIKEIYRSESITDTFYQKTQETMMEQFRMFLLFEIDQYPNFKSFMKCSLYTMDIYALGQTLMYMLENTRTFLPPSFVENMHILLRKMMHNNLTKRITIDDLIEEYTVLLHLLDIGTQGSNKTS